METKKKVILIVDDDKDLLFQMSHILKRKEFEVVEANTQQEAEDKLKEIRPDLAIVDLMMEKKDSGFILCHKIKKTYPNVPVIIVSALTSETGMMFDLTDPSDKDWIKADAFIDKNIRSDQLLSEVNKLLRL
ncbi:MAG: response regulator [Bacteroidales bacterium]|nr:response regulator [Bacteroidales bacterium]